MKDMLLSDLLKQETKANHQQLEKMLVRQMKSVSTMEGYIKILQLFYCYFGGLEEKINNFIIPQQMEEEHFFQRRKAIRLVNDIKVLGGIVKEKCTDKDLPEISNDLQAFGALYVIEGSTLGGRVITKMMQRQVDTESLHGFSFFTGYGDETELRWSSFKQLINNQGYNQDDKKVVVEAANDTFVKFKRWIETNSVVEFVSEK
jgi:heme oxygenase